MLQERAAARGVNYRIRVRPVRIAATGLGAAFFAASSSCSSGVTGGADGDHVLVSRNCAGTPGMHFTQPPLSIDLWE
jgi:hypothetical protein